ncbi:Uncharacterised protein [Streptococcus pneumoniae]|nr:Uncharacterised protein [Streptococcus pneumoniae]
MSIPRQVTRPNHSARSLARGLGWLSIGLGVVQLVAPRQVARLIGMPGSDGVIRACGLREIATGVGILLADDPKPWIYGRIGGDALDLAGLGWSIEHGNEPANAAIAAGAVAGITALDLSCAKGLDANGCQRSIGTTAIAAVSPQARSRLAAASRRSLPRRAPSPTATRPRCTESLASNRGAVRSRFDEVFVKVAGRSGRPPAGLSDASVCR